MRRDSLGDTLHTPKIAQKANNTSIIEASIKYIKARGVVSVV